MSLLQLWASYIYLEENSCHPNDSYLSIVSVSLQGETIKLFISGAISYSPFSFAIIVKTKKVKNGNSKKRLKEERKNSGLTQEQMAKLLGIRQPSYIRYENGSGEPSLATLVKLADILDISLDYLLGREQF